MSDVTPTEIAWAAGLFEGEGCFHAGRRKSGKWAVQVRLGMTDRDVVERFAAVVECGRIHDGRQWKKNPNWKPMHEWYAQAAPDVLKVIELLSPWFGARRAGQAAQVKAAAEEILPYGEERTHCRRGHPYSGANLIVESSGVRRCRTCRTEQNRALKRKQLAISPDRFRV